MMTMIGATMVVATVPVTDLERSKAFYGETLGLEVLWENPASVRFRCGDLSELSIFKRPPVTTEHTLAHFEVTDIEAVVTDLEAKGVEFLDYTEGPLVTTGHIAQIGPARGAWMRDPDGNTLGVRQAL
jgi:catechol 2,3-dioxygenase-like lactoylglutathione lyase family enzyme